jgi:hypothetical protein
MESWIRLLRNHQIEKDDSDIPSRNETQEQPVTAALIWSMVILQILFEENLIQSNCFEIYCW